VQSLYGCVMQISTLSEDEIVQLKSTLHALNDKRFMCGDCVNSHEGELLQKKQAQMACKVDAHEYGLHTIQDSNKTFLFKRCIGNYFNQHVLSWLSIYRSYEKGALPYSGGHQDQPNKAMDIISLIEESKNIDQIKRMEDQKRKMRSMPRGR